MVRTRFAPSPTGFLHIGGARTALFSWAYAKKHHGTFILRVEDTDLERSTQQSVDSIMQAMDWLGLTYDEGPYFQTARLERYTEVIQQMLTAGTAYYCYCSKEELEQRREEQRAQGEKPRYDRRCRHQLQPRSGINPVVRFKNPIDGTVIWNDLVKGRIEIANSELDDLIIARSDGTPTYNFCVVIDDLDMQITHVTRGDDHVNNTPRQINIFKALGAAVPAYAHIPMILRHDGQKMSKRNDPVSVIEYREMGILPAALLNYLARLCWGHGDAEIFSMEQFIHWFDLSNISPAAARFDLKKLLWVNAQHLKTSPNQTLIKLIQPQLERSKIKVDELELTAIIELVKSRSDNLNNLAAEVIYFYQPQAVSESDKEQYLTPAASEILARFAERVAKIQEWTLAEIKTVVKEFCTMENIKMAQLGMPLRLKLCGTTQTPSFDTIMLILGQQIVLKRLTAKI